MNAERFQFVLDTLQATRLDIADQHNAIDVIQDERILPINKLIAAFNADAMATIATATGDDDKPLYKNDLARQAELVVRQTNSPDFAQLETDLRQADADLAARRRKNALLRIDEQHYAALVAYAINHPETPEDLRPAIREEAQAAVQDFVRTILQAQLANLVSAAAEE